MLKDYRVVFKTIRVYWQQLVIGALAISALAALGTFIASDAGSTIAKTILGVFGALGITSASLQTRLKNASQALSSRLRQDVYTDLVAEEITVTPTFPSGGIHITTSSRRSNQAVSSAVGKRSLSAPPP